jgi:hypothetical protein
MFSNHFLNRFTTIKDPKLIVVTPTAINAKLNSFPNPQAITKNPANAQIAMKTQVSKGILH